MLSVFLENGLIPSSQILKDATAPGAKFGYLRKLMDSNNGLFSGEQITLTQFEAETKT
jgi:hypothetical protein